ncbi:segregation/condensation protein A, partial [Arthrobacter sp. SAFR-014]|uniref:segregation/condensation protein A n=1 Tax=Arthrobacter sp. SAFR-014 TaxID=3387280 RepID=UPI003F7B8110
HQPMPAVDRVAFVGNSTAIGVLVADAVLEEGLQLAHPEPVDIGVNGTPEQFAALAARALAPKAPETVGVSHLHAPAVSVSEQLMVVRDHLSRAGTVSFRALTADCTHTLEVVARFLALLELYRQQRVTFEQLTPLGDLHVRWSGREAPGEVVDVDGVLPGPGAPAPPTDDDIDEE